MRRLLVLVIACGGDDGATADAGIDATPGKCQPLGATGQFFHDAANPHHVAGGTVDQGDLEVAFDSPDLVYDGSQFVAYYASLHAPSQAVKIQRAVSPDARAWTIDASVLAPGTTWDTQIDQPSIAINPDAPADHRYLMLYAGASAMLPGHATPAYAIGAVFSADGITFGPHPDAPAITGAAAYPNAVAAAVFDPEVVYVAGMYHAWFSTLACGGIGCAQTIDLGIADATSTDGVTWTIGHAPVSSLLAAAADPTSGGTAPTVVYDAPHCRYEMWLSRDALGDVAAQPVDLDNTAGVFHASSQDGATWHVDQSRDVTWASGAGEHLGMQLGADVAQKGSGRFMLYTGFDDQNAGSATLPARAGGTTPGVTTLELATRDAN
jgi:hypothetical protein